MGTITRNTSVELRVMHCPSCAGSYAILESYLDEAYRLGGFKKRWACPYCREERGYGESAEDRHNKERAALQQRLEAAVAREDQQRRYKLDAQREAEHFRKSRDGMKGQLVKTKKRIHGGACPCCNRHFVQLERHMKTKHPGYGNSEPT